jgi:hypothetical protein
VLSDLSDLVEVLSCLLVNCWRWLALMGMRYTIEMSHAHSLVQIAYALAVVNL